MASRSGGARAIDNAPGSTDDAAVRFRGGLWGFVLISGGCFNPPLNPQEETATDTEVEASTGGPIDPTLITSGADDSSGGEIPCSGNAECSLLDEACVVGVCAPNGVCTTAALDNGVQCDDGAWCTENDVCMGGSCVGTDRVCEGDGPCSLGACNEETDACEVVPDPAQVDMPCDDGDPCTHDGTCVDAECQPGPDACADLDGDCQVGSCGAMGCEVTVMNEGMPCDEGNTCAASTCQVGSCVVMQVLNENAACDDGQWCTAYERCIAGTCTPEVLDPCVGDQGCGAWACDDDLDACVVAAENEGGACDDGLSCTMGTTCAMGACTGGMGPQVVFEEDFADNAAGWGLGPEWEIGPTQQTPCDQERGCGSVLPSAFPGGDPALDHTPTDDNGVGGVVIGGIIEQVIHPFSYLESPPFDGNAVPGPLVLSYYRWLNSDYTPYIENRVEVFDGTAWVTVWASGPSPAVADAPWSMVAKMPGLGWTYQEFDVTPFKNPQMRVRFGFNVDSEGVYPAPGWNVDDVRVAAAGCPPQM